MDYRVDARTVGFWRLALKLTERIGGQIPIQDNALTGDMYR
jgi:hypothetical protein